MKAIQTNTFEQAKKKPDMMYNVMCYDSTNAGFDYYDEGPVVIVEEVDLASAKSIVRHYTKITRDYPLHYWYVSTDGTYDSQYETMCHFYEANRTK